jgi:hypothetical protein
MIRATVGREIDDDGDLAASFEDRSAACIVPPVNVIVLAAQAYADIALLSKRSISL